MNLLYLINSYIANEFTIYIIIVIGGGRKSIGNPSIWFVIARTPNRDTQNFSDSGVLPGAQNGGKCKMTHYYCTRTTSGHLILHAKSTPELVKWHQKSTQKCISWLIFR